ncbi:MAG: DUF5752 family protein, partial [candidate division Zixibacteria bacterium]
DVRPALNLRELYDRISTCTMDSIYHHFCETTLRPSFDDPEYRNDFAVWARYTLNDEILAERLGILDPYDFTDMEALRRAVLDIIDDRLSELSHFPWARQNKAFEFIQAYTMVFDTGRDITNPEDLPYAITQMTTSSLYYHFIEARRRVEGRLDDFTAWLMNWNGRSDFLIKTFSEVDFYFPTLKELQSELANTTKMVMREILIDE